MRNSHIGFVAWVAQAGRKRSCSGQSSEKCDLAELSTDYRHCKSACTALSAGYLMHSSRCRPSNPAKSSGAKPSTRNQLFTSCVVRPVRLRRYRGCPALNPHLLARKAGGWSTPGVQGTAAVPRPQIGCPGMEARLRGSPIRTVPTCWDRLCLRFFTSTDTC